jgi:hypothetical protein
VITALVEKASRFSIDVQPESYVSGTASFRDIYCARKLDFSADLEAGKKKQRFTIEGIALWVSEFLPFATWSAQTRHRSYARDNGCGPGLPTGHTVGILSPFELLQVPPGDWSDVVEAILAALHANGIACLGSEVLSKPLPFSAKISTILPLIRSRQPNLVFDALFYWTD